jgi:hypothetical protein
MQLLLSKQSLTRLVAYPLMHENERYRGEPSLARVRFSINISGRPAGCPYPIANLRDTTAIIYALTNGRRFTQGRACSSCAASL